MRGRTSYALGAMITVAKAVGVLLLIAISVVAWMEFTLVKVASYPSLRAPSALDARARGWLPSWLPRGLREIREIHSVDTNASILVGLLSQEGSVDLAGVCVEFEPSSPPELPLAGHRWRVGWGAFASVDDGKILKCRDSSFVSVAGDKLIRWSSGA